MKEDQDSILITLSQKTIAERRGGYRQIITEWKSADGDPITWWYRLGTAPRHSENIEWVYWVVKGRIRWRCRLAGIEKNKEMRFSNQSKPMYGKNWLILFDFEEIPRHLQPLRKGFQGFRYFHQIPNYL